MSYILRIDDDIAKLAVPSDLVTITLKDDCCKVWGIDPRTFFTFSQQPCLDFYTIYRISGATVAFLITEGENPTRPNFAHIWTLATIQIALLSA